jgi:hypothetical protein
MEKSGLIVVVVVIVMNGSQRETIDGVTLHQDQEDNREYKRRVGVGCFAFIVSLDIQYIACNGVTKTGRSNSLVSK